MDETTGTYTPIFLKIKNYKDFNPVGAGYMQCSPGWVPKQKVRHEWIIHYVVSGKGKYYLNDKVYDVNAGQVFIVPPLINCTYISDEENPWYYIWVDFTVSSDINFNLIKPVHDFDEPELFFNIKNSENITEYRTEYVYAQLLLIYRHLAPTEFHENPYVDMIKNHIATNYMNHITVNGLAKVCNINKDYANRIFKHETGIPISSYITHYKMCRAMEFLEAGYSVDETAHMVGYNEYNSFSKKFKQHFGISPSKAKKPALPFNFDIF